MVRDVVLLGHKQAYCWMDEWFGMTMEELRKFEEQTKEYLDMVSFTMQCHHTLRRLYYNFVNIII
jgi:hypothetical protein